MPSACMPSPVDYLVVGSGVFGASAALELKRSKPNATVVLMDRAPDMVSTEAASCDLNKIIRSDYRDIFYTKLAVEAQAAWRTDPLFKPYYHESGMVFAENVGKGPVMLLNTQLCGERGDEASEREKPKARLMSVDEASKAFPALAGANWSSVQKAYYNPASGWADAEPVLRGIIEAAKMTGVECMQGTLVSLLLEQVPAQAEPDSDVDENLRAEAMDVEIPKQHEGATIVCRGIRTCNDVEIEAQHVLLCTGALTAKLLADAAPAATSLQVSGRLVAAGALSFTVRVVPEKRDFYRNVPVFANLMPHTAGEAIPLNADGLVKFNLEHSFTNLEYHAATGQTISCPPTHCPVVPEALKAPAMNLLRNTYGPNLDGLEIVNYRICWDAFTPSQNWLISRIPTCDNLFIASGGSFHAWKFLPVLGRNIVAMLDGTLEPEKAGRWAWTLNQPLSKKRGGACDAYTPKRDLKDIIAGSAHEE